ncbi:DUF1552 domain-containing protein [Bremerella sp.]|uniref:DUF1552 domain-containing protein n=1 Tax=Bremerella sp. TaxID=2795602 RepID=UPI00391945C2
MKRTHLNRRTLLQGLGTVAIGLPLLEEMTVTPVLGAAKAEVPVRAFNVFFGLGIPAPLQNEGYDGVLEPLKPLRDKLLIMRSVDHVRCDMPGINAHYDGASAAFTAMPAEGTAKAGGPSIDQLVRQQYHPDGLPPGMISTLIAGTFFRRSRVVRYKHSFKDDGTPAAAMQEKPRDLFSRVFGEVPTDSLDPRRQRLSRSVLDSVVQQAQHYTGANSPLGKVSRSRLQDHLDRVREYEQRTIEFEKKAEERRRELPVPPASQLPHGNEADPSGQGIDITLEELTTEWRLMADLYALAIAMDRCRFGSLTFLAAGERIRLTGDYEYNGEKRFVFDDAKQLKASGDKGCSHEWWHQFNEKKSNEQLRAHAHMKMREVAYFLQRLAEQDAMEANGKTILENSLFTISTESGDGRHNDVKRELSGVFHAVTGANGRFKTGEIIDVKAEGLDAYNELLRGMGVQRNLGPEKRDTKSVDHIRA